VQAAITQSDPSLLDDIRHAYDAARHATTSDTTPFRVQCLAAARACGGPGLSAFLGEVLAENNLVSRIEALQIARDLPTVGLETTFRRSLAEPNPRVRLLAAWALVRAGSTTAAKDVAVMIDPRDPGTALEAASAAGILRLEEATPALVAALDQTAGRRTVR
jgi:HEAT repeat protein